MRSWKTTLAGVVVLLTAITGLMQHLVDGTPIDVPQHIAEMGAGIGLLVAADHKKR